MCKKKYCYLYYYYLDASKEVATLMKVQVLITDTAQCKNAYSNINTTVIDDSVCWISRGRKLLVQSI